MRRALTAQTRAFPCACPAPPALRPLPPSCARAALPRRLSIFRRRHRAGDTRAAAPCATAQRGRCYEHTEDDAAAISAPADQLDARPAATGIRARRESCGRGPQTHGRAAVDSAAANCAEMNPPRRRARTADLFAFLDNAVYAARAGRAGEIYDAQDAELDAKEIAAWTDCCAAIESTNGKYADDDDARDAARAAALSRYDQAIIAALAVHGDGDAGD